MLRIASNVDHVVSNSIGGQSADPTRSGVQVFVDAQGGLLKEQADVPDLSPCCLLVRWLQTHTLDGYKALVCAASCTNAH